MDGPVSLGKPSKGTKEQEEGRRSTAQPRPQAPQGGKGPVQGRRSTAQPRPQAPQGGKGPVQEGRKKERGRHSTPKQVRIAVPERDASGHPLGSPRGPAAAAANGTNAVPTNENGTSNMAHTDNQSEGLLTNVQNAHVVRAGNDPWQQQGGLRLATFSCNPNAESPPAVHSTGLVAVEFDKPEVVCTEDMATVDATVRRLGDLRGRLECGWEVRNGNLKDGCFQRMSPKAGTVTFEKGEETATITLPVVRDPAWTVERMYFVDLLPGTLRVASNLDIEPILKANPEMAVYILNQEGFPANVPHDAPLTQLVWGFIRHNVGTFPRETAWGIVFSIFPAVEYFLIATLQELVLSCGVNPDQACDLWWGDISSGGATLLYVVQGLFVGLFVVQYLVRKCRRELRLGGKVVRSLRTSMFATMLQLTPEAKEHYDQGDVPKALDTDVTLAVHCVWLQYFGLLEESFLMGVKALIIIRIALQTNLADTKAAIILAPVVMTLITCLSALRAGRQATMTWNALMREEDWSAFVTMSDECVPIITGYGKGWSVAKKFDSIHSEFNREDARAADYHEDSSEILKGCFALVTALVAVFGGLSVRSRTIEVASFVVLLRAVNGFGESLRSVAGVFKNIALGGAAVRRISDILNEETRRRRHLSVGVIRERSGLFSNSEEAVIALERVCFSYQSQPQLDPPNGGAVPPLSLELPSGHLVHFPSADGRQPWPGLRTLFQLIAGELLPTDGFIVYPPSWTCKYVPVNPILFDGPLILNLYLGEGDPPPSEVIWEVCRALQLSPELIGDEEYDVGIHGDSLRHSDKIIVSIVRALLSDADVVLLGPCLDVLGERAGVEVLRYLKRYIECRGLPQGGPPFPVRHAKTVVYTSKHAVLQGEAQLTVSTVDASGGLAPYRWPSLPGFHHQRMPSLPGFKLPPTRTRVKNIRKIRRAAATAVHGGFGRDRVPWRTRPQPE